MRRRKDPFEKPWVIIAAAAGIIAVVVIALIFFSGSDSSAPSGQSPGQSPSGASAAQQTAAAVVAPPVIKTQIPVTTPTDGVYVKVSYLGGFAGTYGMEGNMTTMRNSGDRFFPVEDAAGEITATFHKEDASTRHEITVGIWKDGNALTTASNSSAYGEVSVSAMV